MIKNRTWLMVGAVAIVAILLVVYVLPSGVSSDQPSANVGIFLKDLETGDVVSAEVVVGEPTNTFTTVMPTASFLPLSSYEGTVDVYPHHAYAIWFSITFRYAGENIVNWDSAGILYSGKTALPNGVLLNSYIASKVTDGAASVEGVNAAMDSEYLTSPITLTISDTFDQYIGYDSTDLKPILGTNLDGVTLDCDIRVDGTDVLDRPVVGLVSASLRISANVLDVSSSITITVDDMSAEFDAGIPTGDDIVTSITITGPTTAEYKTLQFYSGKLSGGPIGAKLIMTIDKLAAGDYYTENTYTTYCGPFGAWDMGVQFATVGSYRLTIEMVPVAGYLPCEEYYGVYATL